jgi:hypothetical protein
MRPEKKNRNKDIVDKRLADPKKWSWNELAKVYNLHRQTVKDLFEYHVDKYKNI